MDGQDEWLMLMTELAALDREAYRRVRAEAWERIAQQHARKTPEEIATWKKNAS